MKSFFKKFAAKTPEAHEHQGDELFAADLWGKAKIEYERALEKLERSAGPDTELKTRLKEKILTTKESLAHSNKRSADDMFEAGFYEDARELYALALELTQDPSLRAELDEKHKLLDFQINEPVSEWVPDDGDPADEAAKSAPPPPVQTGDEYFEALCGTLPEDVQKAYRGYGTNFKKGYLALNQGDFAEAADLLSRALAENPSSGSFIPLELATAYLNLDRQSEAQQLLESLLKEQPQALPAYQLLCELLWEKGAFDRAEALLDSVPQELTESVAVYLLKGETLFRSGNQPAAKAFYQKFLKTYGWNENIARALAKTYEALNELANARNLYQEMIMQCRSCHARIDPFIKQRYADLCFDSGILKTDILELYLSLAQELPDSAADCYQKVSRIYAARGNENEARRFQAIADKMSRK